MYCVLTPMIDEPICVYPRSIERDTESKGKLSLEEHLKLAFMWDDKDEFVNAVKDLSPDEDLPEYLFSPMYAYDAVNCASELCARPRNFQFDIFDTAHGKIKYRHPYFFTVSSPLHEAALFEALNILRLLLSFPLLKQLTRRRINYFSKYRPLFKMRDALPLNVAMAPLWKSSCMEEWSKKKSIFELMTILCRPDMAGKLEAVRLLAGETGEIEEEFFKYMKDGKLAEISVLLLAGCKPPSTSPPHCRDDISEKEKMLELFEVFNAIGDKLSAYIRIKRSKPVEVDQVTSDIASLFEDSGFLGKYDNIPSMYNQSPQECPILRTSDSKNSMSMLFSPPALCGLNTNKGTAPMHGVRQFHKSSVPNVGQNESFVQVKNQVVGGLGSQFYKHRACTYFTTALRRVGRLV